jgi:phenylpyruvate tautomerase PptA (4-oxalocrotonate tautomerase family)
MPNIDVIYPAGALSQEAQAAVAEQLTDIIMEIEGTKGNAAIAAGTWLLLHEAAENTIASGGKFAPGRYRVRVEVPAGALSVEQKADLVRRITDAILQIEGVKDDAAQRARIYCLINEIPDGGWGFAGQVFTRERIEAIRKDADRTLLSVINSK